MMLRMLRQLVAIFALALVPALVSAAIQLRWRSHEPLVPGEVHVATARLWGSHVLWVDTRTRTQFEAGHIPGAILLNDQEWEAQVPKLFALWTANKATVVYGDRSNQTAADSVAQRIRDELKLESVSTLKGG